MAIIEPIREDVENSTYLKKNSKALRFWHWANAIVISGSLITVLINSTIMNRGNVSALIQNSLKDSGGSLSKDQVGSIAHDLGDSVWEIHTYFGYFLAALFLFRLILEFFQVADQKFIRRMKIAYRRFNAVKEQRELALHELTVKIIYLVFYALLLIMVVTGLFLAFEDAMAPFKSIRHTVKDFHGFCMYLIIAFIVVHLAGVFLAERRKGEAGIVSDMINGGAENK